VLPWYHLSPPQHLFSAGVRNRQTLAHHPTWQAHCIQHLQSRDIYILFHTSPDDDFLKQNDDRVCYMLYKVLDNKMQHSPWPTFDSK
jgi:hypothetical protein